MTQGDNYKQHEDYNQTPLPPDDVVRVLDLFKSVVDGYKHLFIPVFGVATGLEGESIRNYRFERSLEGEGLAINYMRGKLEDIVDIIW